MAKTEIETGAATGVTLGAGSGASLGTSTGTSTGGGTGSGQGHAAAGSSPVCRNCHTSTTPLWRRDEHGAVLCNACGLFLKLHGRPRPISLKTDVIKSRNRKGAAHQQTDAVLDKKRKESPLVHASAGPESVADTHFQGLGSPSHASQGHASLAHTGGSGPQTKRRKPRDMRDVHAAETLGTLMKNGSGAGVGASSSNASPALGPDLTNLNGSYPEILPSGPIQDPSSTNSSAAAAIAAAAGYKVSLPHFSMLLGGVPTPPPAVPPYNAQSNSPGPQQEAQNQKQARSVSQPAPQPPSQQKKSPVAAPVASPTLRAHNELLERQSSHLASINEILRSQKPRSEKSASAVASPSMVAQRDLTATQTHTPTITPIPSHADMLMAQAMGPAHSQSEHLAQPESRYSNSPPPMDLQRRNVESSTTSRSSAVDESLVLKSELGHSHHLSQHGKPRGDDKIHQYDERNERDERDRKQLQTQARVARTPSRPVQLPGQATDNTQLPIAQTLQHQEEVIKLRTRISELELVTDLYKRHIFELDAKCRDLETKLNDNGN
ncbi:LAMI_0E12024g1_1 [Lachancea mirantina]|uniref:LAMI_0E12024g1_1 n=1 Tax=Lachancea mirantina TaxID=1230905 RepID=A0A1G4JPW1_9SACH|nr:LAMI_0E12024g1_1 [Lachancea mirantina]